VVPCVDADVLHWHVKYDAFELFSNEEDMPFRPLD
jgi:hypothetical protein